jgi:hypothetical protein
MLQRKKAIAPSNNLAEKQQATSKRRVTHEA